MSELTEAEWDSIACQCSERMCPVHNENADAYIELATCDLYSRVLSIVTAREEALVVLDGLLRRWETVPALRKGTAAAEIRTALGEHLARIGGER